MVRFSSVDVLSVVPKVGEKQNSLLNGAEKNGGIENNN
jgi:hypothetical protein